MAVQPLVRPPVREPSPPQEEPLAPATSPLPRAPVSAQSDESWLSRSVNLIGWSIIVGLVLAAAREPILGTPHIRPALALLGLGILVTTGALWLNRRGTTKAAGRTMAFTLPLLAAGLAVVSGQGARDPALLIMPAALVLSGILLDHGTLAITTGLSVLASAGVLVADARGVIDRSGGGHPYLADVWDVTAILVITGVTVGIVVGRLRRGMERLGQQETALRASELRYRGFVDLAADAIVLGTRAEGITETNRRASELTGYRREELLGQHLGALFSPEELARAPLDYGRVEQGETVVAERILTRKDGGQVPVEMSSTRMPDGTFQSIIRDVSERHRTEEERRSLEARLRQAQKMEAIGRLAGGVAHDFNNLLTAITGNLTLALRRVSEDSPLRRWLSEVDQSAWRAAALTRHLLAFSRQQVIEPKVLDLRTVVSGMESLIARTIGEDVRLRVRLGDVPCRVFVDRGQMEEIVLNLVTNARDAMPDGGLLTVEVERTRPPHLSAVSGRTTRRPRVVVLSVGDTGHGMRDDVKGRIFEPFFTTKPTGSGTGLGLAMVYGAAEQNGGWIEVDSAPGRGSTFRLYVPEAPLEAEALAAPRPKEALQGTETVLLVEDDPTVREVTGEQLESLGYHVLVCSGAHEALTVAAGHDGPLHLLLTDVVMPEMNGRELATRLTERRNGLRVLYTSGYGEDVIARHGVSRGGVHFLRKPFSLEALGEHVRRALAP